MSSSAAKWMWFTYCCFVPAINNPALCLAFLLIPMKDHKVAALSWAWLSRYANLSVFIWSTNQKFGRSLPNVKNRFCFNTLHGENSELSALKTCPWTLGLIFVKVNFCSPTRKKKKQWVQPQASPAACGVSPRGYGRQATLAAVCMREGGLFTEGQAKPLTERFKPMNHSKQTWFRDLRAQMSPLWTPHWL